MHSISEVGTNVPAFLAKLWKLVEDPTTNGLISWSANGSSFLIRNQAQFSRELLPLYYKHNNLASFIRQLNMYGFHKITSVEGGGLKVDKDEMEFAHKFFLRGHPYLLDNIKRKIPTGAVSSGSSSSSPSGSVKPELVSRVLQDVRQMKGRQETLDSRFNAMKRENEALWRELALLRQKHMKQQQIVNKLIQFLVTLVQPNRGLGIKRTYPLMLNDTPNRNIHSNSRRGVTQPKVAKLNLISDVMAPEELSPKGPVIHELDNNVEYILPDDNYDDDLSSVEFVGGQEGVDEGARVGAGAGVQLRTLRSGIGCYDQGQPVSPEVGAEAGDVPIQLAKELDRVVPLVQSPSSSLGNLDSMPSSPVYTTETSVHTGNQVEDVLAAESDPQVNVPENCLLPSVEYPMSPEMFMGSVDPAVVSPAPSNQASKKKGQGFRNSKNGAKGKVTASSVDRLVQSPNNRKTKGYPVVPSKEATMETVTQDLYPEIHLEEGNTAVNDEEAMLLNSVVGGEDNDDIDVDVETPVLPEENINVRDKDDSNMALACTLGSSSGERESNTDDSNIREELDMHLDTMQSELDMLKDMLMKGNVSPITGGSGNEGDILSGVGGLEGYCLDASALLGVCPASLGHLLDPAVCEGGGHILSKLFGSDDPVPFGINSFPGSSLNTNDNTKENPDLLVSGNELATYNPTLLDLVEDDDNSQLLNWCDAASSDQKDTLGSTCNTVTSSTESRERISGDGKVIGVTGKGSGKGGNASVIVPKNSSQVRRKPK